MASKIKMSLTIDPKNVEIWCKRSGFTVITPLEILQNKQLGLKKVEEIETKIKEQKTALFNLYIYQIMIHNSIDYHLYNH